MCPRTLARLVWPGWFVLTCALVFAAASVVLGGCGSSGELKLGDTATVFGGRATVKSVTYGVSECEQQLGLSGSERLNIQAGYTAICIEYDWESGAEQEVETEGPTATPGQHETMLLDSAGEEHEREMLTLSLDTTPLTMKALFAVQEGRGAVALIFRDLETGEEVRWPLD